MIVNQIECINIYLFYNFYKSHNLSNKLDFKFLISNILGEGRII